MKKFLIAALMVASFATAQAQQPVGTLSIQPKVGFNLASLTKFDDTSMRAAVVTGAEGMYQVSDIFGLSAGLLYSQQGVDFDGDAACKLDYLNIPLMANVYVAKGFALKVGIQPGFMINDNIKDYSVTLLDYKISIDDGLKKFDFSIPVGLSYEFANFVFDARYNLGVTDVFDWSDAPKNSVFQFTFGYKFVL